MAYTRRPLNPLIPFVNQVVVESDKVNVNFDILANAFQGGDPATGIVLNAVNSQYSENAVNSQYSQDADKVDGFHASLTPAPNTIPVALSTGKLDLGWLPDGIVNRRVDLTDATSDYELQVGEEAIISFTDATSVPLRITTGSNRLYEIFLQFSVNFNTNTTFTFLNPNNTTYASSFSHASVYWSSGGSSGWVVYTTIDNAFRLFSQIPHSYIILDTTRRILRGFLSHEFGTTAVSYGVVVSKWHSALASWTSLGTFIFPASMSGYILVRRLV